MKAAAQQHGEQEKACEQRGGGLGDGRETDFVQSEQLCITTVGLDVAEANIRDSGKRVEGPELRE